MAINAPPFHTTNLDPFETEINFTDVAIQGKMVTARLEINALDELNFINQEDYRNAIKKKIASELARAMIESNLVEFTQMKDAKTYNTLIHARCYLAPNDQVKLLRLHNANLQPNRTK